MSRLRHQALVVEPPTRPNCELIRIDGNENQSCSRATRSTESRIEYFALDLPAQDFRFIQKLRSEASAMKNWRRHSMVINLIAALVIGFSVIVPFADAKARQHHSSVAVLNAAQSHASDDCPTDAESHHNSAEMHCAGVSIGVDSKMFAPTHRTGEQIPLPTDQTLEPILWTC